MRIKKIYLLPNVITAFGVSCGLFVIFKMNMATPGHVNEQLLTMTAGILLLAALADLLDGAVARAMKAESDFGGFFDCIADAITFGVGPSVIVLKSVSVPAGTEMSLLMMTAAMVYSVCGVLRLVRFSVSSSKEKQEEPVEDAGKKNFTGLPIPAAAAAAVSSNLFLFSSELQYFVTISETTRVWILFVILITLGYFMVSRWKFPSLKTFHVRVVSFQRVFLTVVCTVLLFYGLFQHFPLVFFAAAWSYVIIAWVLSIIRLISGRKLKTLEDFEPESDDEEEDP